MKTKIPETLCDREFLLFYIAGNRLFLPSFLVNTDLIYHRIILLGMDIEA